MCVVLILVIANGRGSGIRVEAGVANSPTAQPVFASSFPKKLGVTELWFLGRIKVKTIIFKHMFYKFCPAIFFCKFYRLSSTTKPPTPGRRTPLYPGRLTPGRMTPKFTRIFEQIPFQGSRDPHHGTSTNLGVFTPPSSAASPRRTPGSGPGPSPGLNPNPRNHNDPNPRNHNDMPMTPRSQEISNILNDLLEMPNPPNYWIP